MAEAVASAPPRNGARSKLYSTADLALKGVVADGQTVATYDLHDVIPVRWTGPSLNADQPKVLTETLEIAHNGFVNTGSKY